MKKDKVVKVNKIDNNISEVVVAEKVIDTKPKKNDISKDPLILEISTALFAVEEMQSKIIKKLDQICTRIGVPKI